MFLVVGFVAVGHQVQISNLKKYLLKKHIATVTDLNV